MSNSKRRAELIRQQKMLAKQNAEIVEKFLSGSDISSIASIFHMRDGEIRVAIRKHILQLEAFGQEQLEKKRNAVPNFKRILIEKWGIDVDAIIESIGK